MKKTSMLLAAMVVLGGVYIGGQTLAYLTDSHKVTNTFTVGDLDIDEHETDWDDETDGKNLYPGCVLYKNPTVKNISSSDNNGYLRMKVEILDGENKPITDLERNTAIWKTIRFDESYTGTFDAPGAATGLVEGFDASKTEAAISGYPMVNGAFEEDTTASASDLSVRVFNYKNVFKKGDSVILFTNVAIPSDWSHAQLLKLGTFKLVVTAEAIQQEGFADYKSALSALAAEAANRDLARETATPTPTPTPAANSQENGGQ